MESSTPRELNLARQITSAFASGALNVEGRDVPRSIGWDALPEVTEVAKLRDKGASDVSVRLFCTFAAAMDRARDATRLWSNSADLFMKEPWAFEPQKVAQAGIGKLGETLKSFGVSQRHGPDANAWLAIGKTLSTKTNAPVVYEAIYNGAADTALLLAAIGCRN
jgi:hypothetical protein